MNETKVYFPDSVFAKILFNKTNTTHSLQFLTLFLVHINIHLVAQHKLGEIHNMLLYLILNKIITCVCIYMQLAIGSHIFISYFYFLIVCLTLEHHMDYL